MNRRDKLVREICWPPVPPQAATKDVFALLESSGWLFVRFRGNNYAIFESSTGDLLNVPMVQGRRVKRAYLRLVCQKLGLDEEPGSAP